MPRAIVQDTELKRLPVKYLRDWIKKHYKIRDECFICRTTNNLELHHLYSLSELFHTWCKKNGVSDITKVDQIMELREKFEADTLEELSHDNLLTLCKTHHQRLHNIYGQTYPNGMVPKIKNWVNIQREKLNGS